MTELFNIPETPSPRLAWLKKHDVRTWKNPCQSLGSPWRAWQGELYSHSTVHVVGQTEDEALTNLAKALNIPLWNEEGFKR